MQRSGFTKTFQNILQNYEILANLKYGTWIDKSFTKNSDVKYLIAPKIEKKQDLPKSWVNVWCPQVTPSF